ncbi:MAG: FAD-binding oxidoreductase, partial [Cyclobacteriaceae bacterium]
MAHKFYPLEVIDIHKTTEEAVVLSFQVKPEWQEVFRYQAGQYLTLQTNIDNIQVRRSYSLCSSPLDNQWKVAVKKVDGGVFSTFANEKLKVGDTMEALPPNGRFFTAVESEKRNDYAAFAAGSGITPILSIIKTHLQAEPQSSFKLFYTNQHVSDIMLKEEIEALKNKYMDRFQIFHFLTKQAR